MRLGNLQARDMPRKPRLEVIAVLPNPLLKVVQVMSLLEQRI